MKLNLVLAAITGVANSVWTGAILVAFLAELTDNSNTKVGLITALQGLTQLVTALPSGWAADRYSRSMVVAVGGGMLLLSTAATAWAVISSIENHSNKFLFMCVGLGLLGFSKGVMNGPAQ